MGSWGYEALDSDQALDWLGNEITDHAEQKIVDLLDEFGKNLHIDRESAVEAFAFELRAAGYVVVTLNFWQRDLHARTAAALQYVRDEQSWLSQWGDGGEGVRKSLDEQIAKLGEGPQSTTLMENLS